MHGTSRMAVAVATIAVALSMSSAAHAGGRRRTVTMPPLATDGDGYVYCRVVATSRTPIAIVATILNVGANVTDFGSGFRASPAATDDGRFHAEETAGSFADGVCRCQVSVKDAQLKDVRVTFTAFDAEGHEIATVER